MAAACLSDHDGLSVLLRINPAPDIRRAVDDVNSRGFGVHEKVHCCPIRHGDVLQVEDDVIVQFARNELLQTGRMFNVHLSAENEHDRIWCCRTLDPVCHVPVLHNTGQSK